MIVQTDVYHPRFTSGDLTARIVDRVKELATATDAARVSREMLRYLEASARFHQYSPGNIWLILMARPDASRVAGFQCWRSLNRFVRKGEQGIPILAPIFMPEDLDDPDSKQVLRGFKVVYVFDIAQTEGEPLPSPPDWKSPEQNAVLTRKLTAFASSRKITVSVKKLSSETQGVSRGGAIDLDPGAGTKTLIHEIAHELMHRGEDRPSEPRIRELEAESVAYVVGRHFGLEGLSSPNYIALHGATSELILAHLERIRATAAGIINAVDGD